MHAKAAFDSLGSTAMLNEKIPTRGLYALTLLQTGDGTGARATAREVLPLLGRIRRPIAHGSLEGYAGLSTVALAAWQDRPDDWQESDVLICLDLLDRYRSSFAIGEPRYLLHLGHYARACGDVDAARKHYADGETAARRLGMPWEEARCREAIAAVDGVASGRV
jgi:hypothetical protein